MKSSTIVKTAGVVALLLFTGCSSTGNTTSSLSSGSGVGYAVDSSDQQPEATPSAGTPSKQQQGSISLKRNFYFVFDGSGSMQHFPKRISNDSGRSMRKIDGAKWAVHEFLKKVPNDVNLGLYVFDRNGKREEVSLASNNRSKFLTAIDAVEVGGNTPLGDAIGRGSNALWKQYKKQLGYGEYRLIVITDGDATDFLPSGVAQAKEHKIPIYTIGFDMDQDHELRKHSISYRSADSAAEVEQGLEEAAAELDMFDPTTFHGTVDQTATKQN